MSPQNSELKTRNSTIIGCGWLGLPVARQLAKAGARVRGTTTSRGKLATLREVGIEPHVLKLPENDASLWEVLNGADTLVLTLPPDRRADDPVGAYLAKIEAMAVAIQQASVQRVVFTSSTGVYPNSGEEVDEDTPPDPSRTTAEATWQAEQLLHERLGDALTVLRLGGLYGPSRPPGRFFAGREDLAGADAPVNLVHQDDAVAAVLLALEHPDAPGQTFNVVAPAHPRRRVFYPAAARALGRTSPTFSDELKPHKTVRSERIQQVLGFEFTHRNPLADVQPT